MKLRQDAMTSEQVLLTALVLCCISPAAGLGMCKPIGSISGGPARTWQNRLQALVAKGRFGRLFLYGTKAAATMPIV